MATNLSLARPSTATLTRAVTAAPLATQVAVLPPIRSLAPSHLPPATQAAHASAYVAGLASTNAPAIQNLAVQFAKQGAPSVATTLANHASNVLAGAGPAIVLPTLPTAPKLSVASLPSNQFSPGPLALTAATLQQKAATPISASTVANLIANQAVQQMIPIMPRAIPQREMPAGVFGPPAASDYAGNKNAAVISLNQVNTAALLPGGNVDMNPALRAFMNVRPAPASTPTPAGTPAPFGTGNTKIVRGNAFDILKGGGFDIDDPAHPTVHIPGSGQQALPPDPHTDPNTPGPGPTPVTNDSDWSLFTPPQVPPAPGGGGGQPEDGDPGQQVYADDGSGYSGGGYSGGGGGGGEEYSDDGSQSDDMGDAGYYGGYYDDPGMFTSDFSDGSDDGSGYFDPSALGYPMAYGGGGDYGDSGEMGDAGSFDYTAGDMYNAGDSMDLDAYSSWADGDDAGLGLGFYADGGDQGFDLYNIEDTSAYADDAFNGELNPQPIPPGHSRMPNASHFGYGFRGVQRSLMQTRMHGDFGASHGKHPGKRHHGKPPMKPGRPSQGFSHAAGPALAHARAFMHGEAPAGFTAHAAAPARAHAFMHGEFDDGDFGALSGHRGRRSHGSMA